MNEQDLETRLRRYRPAAPRPELRARALSATVDQRRTWPWAVAAAALFAVTIGFGTAARGLRNAGEPELPPAHVVDWTGADALEVLHGVYGEDLPLVLARAEQLAAFERRDIVSTSPEVSPWR